MRWYHFIVLAAVFAGCSPDGENIQKQAEIAAGMAQKRIDENREKIRQFVEENAGNISNYAMKFAKSDDLTREIKRLLDASIPDGAKSSDPNAVRLLQKSDLAEIYAERDYAPIFVASSDPSPVTDRLAREFRMIPSHCLSLDATRWENALNAWTSDLETPPAPFVFSPQETQTVARFIEDQSIDIGDPASVRSLVAKLVAEATPVPRLREAVLTRAREMTRLARAAAELEIETADLAMRFARAMAFENMTHLTKEENALLGKKNNTAKVAQIRAASWFRELAQAAGQIMPQNNARGANPENGAAPNILTAEENDAAGDGSDDSPDAQIAQTAEANDAPARHVRTPDEIIGDLYPPHPGYRLLMKARDKYAALPDWGRVSCPAKLTLSKPHKCIPALKKRLAAEGYYLGDVSETAQSSDGFDIFDAGVRDAMRDYIETHQLAFDEEKGYEKAFWSSLNVPRSERLAQIGENLRRWHKTHIVKSPYYIFINIPEFYGAVWRGGKEEYRFPVVVGNARRQCSPDTKQWRLVNATPLMHARMLYVEYNPYWNVPGRIEQEDYIKKINADPNWLKDHGFEYYSEKGYTILRQLPGEKNALGRVKFIFPNAHATFMHDSPQKGLFRYPIRAFSHGCMRVWEPLTLAKRLLTDDGQWRPELETEIDDYVTRRIVLKNRFDVFIDYFTVKSDENGRVFFFADPYRYVRDALNPPAPQSLECTPSNAQFIPRSKAALGGDDVGVDDV